MRERACTWKPLMAGQGMALHERSEKSGEVGFNLCVTFASNPATLIGHVTRSHLINAL